MAKFNKTTTLKTVTKAGGISYGRNDIKKDIASMILNSLLNGDAYYQSEVNILNDIENLISNNLDNAEFIAKAMIYVRNEGNLRSISHFIAVLLSEKVKGTSYMKHALNKILLRPDDALEIIALWNNRNNGKMIPNPIRKATKEALENKWDAYQLKKYFGNGSIKVSNLINLFHPKPNSIEQEIVFKQALENNLPSIDTVQTVNAGLTDKDRGKKYIKMLKENKLGYMGLLKNIKNILETYSFLNEKKQMVLIDLLCSSLENEKSCIYSKVLPFRFIQAYEIVNTLTFDRLIIKRILNSIEKGFIISSKNIPIVEEDEKVALLLDESASMGSGNSSPFGIGKTLMASMLSGLDKNNTIGYFWANKAREVSIDDKPMSFLSNTYSKGGGTDVWAPIEKLISNKTFVDKLIIFTDMQMYEIGRYSWNKQREFKDMVKAYRKINPNVKVLFWNLQNYKTGTPMKLDNNILEVNGFSNNILEVVAKIWKDKDALINEIEKIKL